MCEKKEDSPKRSLTPFLLIQFGDEACFSSPQDVVTGKVHGFVEVADGEAEPQHTVREVDGPLGSFQCLHRVSQTQHCGTQTHISHSPSALALGTINSKWLLHSHFLVRLMWASS